MRILRRPLQSLVIAGGLASFLCSTPAHALAQASGGQVVVRATTRDGQPVTDLKPGDLSLRIDGKPRDVKGLELVQPDASATAGSTAPAPAASSLPAPFSTNSGSAPATPRGTREILVAIDDEGIGSGREQPIRDAVKSIIDKLSPADRIGVIAMKQGGLNLAPTTNHASVMEALSRLVMTGSARESEGDLTCRTKVMLGSLDGFLRGGGPERSVVFVSAAMAPPSMDAVKRVGTGDTNLNNQACEIRPDDYDGLGRAASTSAPQLFVVAYIEGVANPANRRTGQTGLESIAGVTGAEYIVLSGSPDVPATRIAKTAGVYYLADVDGSVAGTRRIDAQVARDGIRVVARPVAATGAPAAAVVGKAVTPKEMMGTAAVFRDLPLRSAAYVSRQPNSKDLKVMVLFEPETPGTKLTAATVGFYNSAGKLVAQWNARPEELGRSPITAAVTIAPGAYRMRVAALADAKSGTTDTSVEAQLATLPPLTAGAMILGGSQGGFVPKLLFTSQDAAAVGLFEVYGVTKDTKLDVTFEIAKDEKSDPLGTGPGTIANGPGEDARIIYGGFGLAPVEPGDYLLRATITVDGKKAGVVSKTIRKVQ